MNILPFSWLRNLSVLILITCPLVTQGELAAQETPPFDMEEFFKELEKELTKIEAEEKQKEPQTPTTPSMPTPNAGQTIEKETTEAITPDQQPVKLDPESLFIEPATQKVTKKKDGRSITTIEPTRRSIAAYKKISKRLSKTLDSLQNKAVSTTTPFSPAFVDTFMTQGTAISNDIEIVLETIGSKKAYESLFLTPPTDNKILVPKLKDLRKKIVNLTKKLKAFDDDVVITPEMEETEESEDVLRTFATKQPQLNISKQPLQPLAKPSHQEQSASKTEELQPSFDIAELMTEEEPIPSTMMPLQPEAAPFTPPDISEDFNETLLKNVTPSNVRMFDEK